MNRINLGLAIHNHQPVGNFPWVFEDAYTCAYLPMVDALLKHPFVNVSLHYSGCLYDWITENHPEFIDLLKELVGRGQAEIIGGGYYEPILPSIPNADKAGQLAMMSGYIERIFGTRPDGMWLAERVWEQGLAKVISEAGLGWTMADDTGFRMVGLGDNDLFGYFNTEEQGRYVKIFPISKYLRYAIPWHTVDRVLAYLRENASEDGSRIAVLGDDGEKFGVWPKTYEHCWEDGWVENFFEALEDNAEWLATVKLGEYAREHRPAGRIYLPCASYDEMMEWSLPAEKSWEYSHLRHSLADEGRTDILHYLYSGYWRNFMVKYPEINRMHKKMLLVHDKVHKARKIDDGACGIGHLWKAQCNCPYWHGIFGGIYLSDIRAVTYSNLIKAENNADDVLRTNEHGYDFKRLDFDGDGYEEVLVEGPDFNLYISPHEGGSIFEWDHKGKEYNLLSSMSRRYEGYHRDILEGAVNTGQGEDGVKSIHDAVTVKQPIGKPAYDVLPRSSLVDHFLAGGTTLEDFEKNEFSECGDFAGKLYEFSRSGGGQRMDLFLEREGRITSGGIHSMLAVRKKVSVTAGSSIVSVEYTFTNKGDAEIDTVFGSEWNINLLGGGHNDSAYYRVEGRELEDGHLDSRGVIENVQQLIMGNSYLEIEIKLELDRPVDIWRYPVESISNSEGGVEQVYQCSCVMVRLPLKLKPGQTESFSYSWDAGL